MSTTSISPIGNVLVPFDGTVHDPEMLLRVHEFVGSGRRFTILLLTETTDENASQLKTAVQTGASEAADRPTDIRIESCDTRGNPAETIVESAHDIHAQMIVWSEPTQLRQGSEWRPIDSITLGEELALTADIPVMLLPAIATQGAAHIERPTRVLVPLDGSATSNAAIPIAGVLARLFDIPIHLMTVIDSDTALPPAYAHMYDNNYDRQDVMATLQFEANQALNLAESTLREAGIDVSSSLVEGHVIDCLIGATAKNDLVVMTTHGKGNASRSRFGSMALQIIRRASVPVVVLHPSAASLANYSGGSSWSLAPIATRAH
ncbi:MAG: universal stress protein [Thermomicrobiales bacterium]